MRHDKQTGQGGFSLLEVMIAGALLAVALLALAALAVRSLQDAADALDHRLAVLLLADLQGRVTLASPAGPGSAGRAAVGAEFVAWRSAAEDLLPNARARLCLAADPVGPTAPGVCGAADGWEAALHWRRQPGVAESRQDLAWSR